MSITATNFNAQNLAGLMEAARQRNGFIQTEKPSAKNVSSPVDFIKTLKKIRTDHYKPRPANGGEKTVRRPVFESIGKKPEPGQGKILGNYIDKIA